MIIKEQKVRLLPASSLAGSVFDIRIERRTNTAIISDYILRIPARGPLRCWRMITDALNSMLNQTFDRIPCASFVQSFFCLLYPLCQKMIRFHYLSLGQWSSPFFSSAEKHFEEKKKHGVTLLGTIITRAKQSERERGELDRVKEREKTPWHLRGDRTTNR